MAPRWVVRVVNCVQVGVEGVVGGCEEGGNSQACGFRAPRKFLLYKHWPSGSWLFPSLVGTAPPLLPRPYACTPYTKPGPAPCAWQEAQAYLSSIKPSKPSPRASPGGPSPRPASKKRSSAAAAGSPQELPGSTPAKRQRTAAPAVAGRNKENAAKQAAAQRALGGGVPSRPPGAASASRAALSPKQPGLSPPPPLASGAASKRPAAKPQAQAAPAPAAKPAAAKGRAKRKASWAQFPPGVSSRVAHLSLHFNYSSRSRGLHACCTAVPAHPARSVLRMLSWHSKQALHPPPLQALVPTRWC